MDISINRLKERNEATRQAANGYASADQSYKHMNEQLEQITRYLMQEMEYKQRIIEEQRLEVEQLKKEIDQRSMVIAGMEQQLTQCAQHNEGHRQLINKLLNDIEHFQNDIEWYKRTYERRSIWGILKEKLTKKK